MTLTVDPDWWQTLFDEVYLTTDARSVGDEALTRREVDVFSELIPMHRRDRILDLCGGHGRHSLELCRRGYSRCTVFDFSMPLLTEGKKNALRHQYPIDFLQGDARHLQLRDCCVNHVLIVGNSLGYVPGQDADLQILKEAWRVLQPAGCLLLDVADGRSVRKMFKAIAWHEIGSDVVVCRQRELEGDVICARELVISKSDGLIRDQTYCMQLYSAEQLLQLLRRAGFTAVQLHTDFSPHEGRGDYGFMNHRMIVTAVKPG